MKKIKLYLLAFVAVASSMYLTSCKKDETVSPTAAAPVITLKSAPIGFDTNAVASGKFTITFNLAAAGEFSSITAKRTQNGVSTDISGYPKTSSSTYSSKTSEDVVITDSVNAGNVTYSFSVTDKNTKTVTRSWTLKKKADYTTWSNLTFSSDTVGAARSTKKAYFSASNATTYTPADAKTNAASVDFGYFQGNSKGTVIFSPNDATAASFGPLNNAPGGLYDWTPKNQTKLKLVTSDVSISFDSPVAASLATALGSSVSSSVTNLVNNDVIAFQNAAGKNGLIKVISTSGAYPGGSLTITVKYFN